MMSKNRTTGILKKGLVNLLVGAASLLPSSACKLTNYDNLGFPQGFSRTRFEIGQGEFCFGINFSNHSILGIPVAPPFYIFPDDNCEAGNPAPNIDEVTEPNGGPFPGAEFCAKPSNVLHGDLEFKVKASDSDAIAVGANVYKWGSFAAENQQLIPEEAYVVTNEGDFRWENDRFVADQKFVVRPIDANNVPTGDYVLGIFVTDKNKTASLMYKMHVQGVCANNNVTGLGDLVDWACANLPRAAVVNTRFFAVEGTPGNYSFTENPELSPFDPQSANGTLYHILPSGDTHKWFIATAGLPLGNPQKMSSGIDGPLGNISYNPPDCKHLLILDPKKEAMPKEVYSITAVGEGGSLDYVESVRGLP